MPEISTVISHNNQKAAIVELCNNDHICGFDNIFDLCYCLIVKTDHSQITREMIMTGLVSEVIRWL